MSSSTIDILLSGIDVATKRKIGSRTDGTATSLCLILILVTAGRAGSLQKERLIKREILYL